MIVKKYKADTETAAILAAKEDLGPEAVVLNVKTMKQRGFAKFFKHDYVEITAALEEKEFEQKVSSRRPAVNAAATKEIKPAADIRKQAKIPLRRSLTAFMICSRAI